MVKRAMQFIRGSGNRGYANLNAGKAAMAAGWHPAAINNVVDSDGQRSNSDRVILEKSGPQIPSKSASRVEGTSISRNV